MKILIFAPYIGSNYGGTSKAVKELVESVSGFGTKVDLITTNANQSDKLTVPLNRWLESENYRIKYFSCWNRNDFIISLSLIQWLIHHIKDYDVVHTNTIFAPIVSFVHWLCQQHKVPYVMTPHGMLEPWALSYKAWKKKLYFNLVEKSSLQKAHFIQVIANSEAGHVKALGLQNPVVIPNGVHKKEFISLPEPDIFYQQFPSTYNKTLILFLGRIDPKKGLDLLAPAFAKVRKRFPQTHLVVAGPDSTGYLLKVKTAFKQVGCLDAVTFTGMLTGSLKYAALAAASVYVAPSYSEGFSMSVLEGMASGLPCVITTGCNFPEAAMAKAALVVDIKTHAIADGLIQCLSHPQMSKAMGNRARNFIFQNYTWDCAAEKLTRVYKAIVNQTPLSTDLVCENFSVQIPDFSKKSGI
jgi:glycosyltransferase involved in cell wall biosynthesis